MECPTTLDFTEALKDSPRFRKQLHDHEQYFARLETKLNDVLRLVTVMVDYGQNYVATFYNLTSAMTELSKESFSYDPLTVGAFTSISDAYTEVVNVHKVLIEQAHWSIHKNISAFLNELGKVHETRQHFEQLSSSLDDALARKAGVPRHKTADVAESKNALTAVGTCFAHTALDYVAQVNVTHARKNFEILDAFSSFLRACRTFFDQGHMFFGSWSSIENGVIADTIDSLKAKSKQVERKMQDRHMLVPREVFQHPTGMSPDPDVVMEGYLFKRATNAFKTWNRRWFQIRDSKLLYCHRTSDDIVPTVMEPDLKLCLVRPAPASIERACCFELVTPTKSHLLQADSESLCNAWMRALQRTIHHLHESEDQDAADPKSNFPSDRDSVKSVNSTGNGDVASSVTVSSSPGRSRRSMLEELRVVAGNDLCADCGAPNPKWASINLGVTLCIECCGIHRSLGVQISKVRSLTMDSFDSEHRRLMLLLGNTRVNAAYLAYLPNSDVVPPPAKPNCARAVREAWIKAKYVERRFSRPSKERTRDAAQARNDHLCSSKHKNSIGANVQPLSPTRSASMLNLSAEGEKAVEPATPPAAANPDTPTINASLSVWRSSPSLHRRQPSPSPNSQAVDASDAQEEFRPLSSCGSDTNLGGSEDALEERSSNKRNVALLKAAMVGDLQKMCVLLAQGADVNVQMDDTTPVHVATARGSSEVVEYLLLNGARMNVLDGQLDTPLHIAAAKGNDLIVCQLLKRGAQKDLKNSNGHTPLDLAVEGKSANIVTLLRLQQMRDEFSEEFNNPMDETVDGIMDDISRRANQGR